MFSVSFPSADKPTGSVEGGGVSSWRSALPGFTSSTTAEVTDELLSTSVHAGGGRNSLLRSHPPPASPVHLGTQAAVTSDLHVHVQRQEGDLCTAAAEPRKDGR